MDLGILQRELAPRLGVREESVRRWESDLHRPSSARMAELYRLFGEPPAGIEG